MNTPLFSVQQPRASIRGRSFILQGPVSAATDIIKVWNNYLSTFDNEFAPAFTERFIPKERFFSNRGLRWYIEVPVEPGSNTFNVAAGIYQSYDDTEIIKPTFDVLAGLVDMSIYFLDVDTEMGDAGPWTTNPEASLAAFESRTSTWGISRGTSDPVSSYFRYGMTIPSSVRVVAARLALRFNDAIQIYLDGSSVYASPAMPGSGWGYTDTATGAVADTIVTTAVDPTLFTTGTHALAIAHKAAGAGADINLSVTLELDIQRIQWTEPQQIQINISETQVDSGHNFNHLDEWGMFLGVDRFPSERNVEYKRRLQQYVSSEFGPTIDGITRGASARLGMPTIPNAIVVELNEDQFARTPSSIATDLTVSISRGVLQLSSAAFKMMEDDPAVDENYNLIRPSGTVYTVEKMFGKSLGDLEDHQWTLDADGNILLFNSPDPFGYQVDYTLWHTYEFADRSLLDVVTWLNRVQASGTNASGQFAALLPFSAFASRDAKFLTYSGQLTTLTQDSTLVHSSGDLNEFVNEDGLHFNISGDEFYYPVDRVSGTGIYLDTPYLELSASGGDFELVKTIPAPFISDSQIQSGVSDFTLAAYQLGYRPFLRSDWDAYNSIDNPNTEEVMNNIEAVRRSIRSNWDEVIVDEDMWDVIEAGIAGGATIPNIYDGPKTLYTSAASGTVYTPAQALNLNFVDPSGGGLRPMLFASGDFQSGTDLQGDSLDVQEVVSSSGSVTISPSGLLNISQEWIHASGDFGTGWGLGYYQDQAYYRHDASVIPPSGSGTITTTGMSEQLAFYMEINASGSTRQVFGHSKFNNDYNNHMVGVPVGSGSLHERDIVLDRADEDWRKSSFKRLMIDGAWQGGSIIIGDYAGRTGDLFLLINHVEGEDVISDGPTLVLRVQDEI